MTGVSSHGLLLIDKPQGVTSFDAVAAVRGALRTKKVGHAGTLDPMATGLLVVGFGHATRLLQYIVEHDKTYEATIRLGGRTDTDDAEGEAVEPGEAPVVWPGACDWRALVERTLRERFTGDIEQVPNTFSAIKINGRRAYDLAREGKDVELKARPVHVSEFTVLDARAGFIPARAVGATAEPTDIGRFDPAGYDGDMTPVLDLDVRVGCSSGTYVRALARDLGDALGMGGYLTRLRRTRVGRFALSDDASALASTIAPPASTDETSENQTDGASDGTRVRAIGARTETKTYVDREGRTVTRGRCVLATPPDLSGEKRGDWLRERAIRMDEAARGAMPVLAIDADEARELRFGRRLHRALPQDGPAAAIVEATGDVAAIVTRAGARQSKPVVVFPER